MKIFQREQYVQQLISSRGNGLVKIITGIRRCGKSFLLFNLWHQWLISHEVLKDHIIELQIDDRENIPLRNPDNLLQYINTRLVHDGQMCYIILDEIQLVDDFVGVLLSLMHKRDVDVYVSGSNSRFLSTDVVTEFRGRGEEIRVWPLTFAEYFQGIGGDRQQVWKNYYTFGGLPQLALLTTEQQKIEYLVNLYKTTYFRDIVEHNHLRNQDGLEELIQVLASNIGATTNPQRIVNTFLSTQRLTIKPSTIKQYLHYLREAFLIEEALRYDVKGRKYIGTETKYYFADLGIRAAILGFRQQEESHIMENIIYNELRSRGYQVDVGMVEAWSKNSIGKNERKQLEVDFVVNRPPRKYYIQSVLRMSTIEKEIQERKSLLTISDHFPKIIIVGEDIYRKEDEQGVMTIGLLDFLEDKTLLE